MKTAFTLLINHLLAYTAQAQYGYYPPGKGNAQPPYTIQVALLLDASGSMDGLIDQAKSRLWHIVNDLSAPDDYGRLPMLEFALYEYGRSNLSRQSGYIRQVVPFTQDLDWLAEELFRLRIGGGEEYCGQVILRSVEELDWTRSPRDLRFIYIAGNESFRQGQVDARMAISRAYDRGIYVNTIFCGDYREGIRLGWEDGARMGGGIYTNIDQNNGWQRESRIHYQHLSSLNQQLNYTYIPYGAQGEICRLRQEEQDRRMNGYGQNYATERYLAKAGSAYNNAHWGLGDAVASGSVSLEQIPDQQLPPEMRGKRLQEKQAYVADKQAERSRLQSEIRTLAIAERKQPAPAEVPATVNPGKQGQQPAAQPAPKTLDKAIEESVKQKRQEMETPRQQQQPMSPAQPAVSRNPVAGQPARSTAPQVAVPAPKATVPAPQTSAPAPKAIAPAPKTDPGQRQSDAATAIPAPAKPVTVPEKEKENTVRTLPAPSRTDGNPAEAIPSPGKRPAPGR